MEILMMTLLVNVSDCKFVSKNEDNDKPFEEAYAQGKWDGEENILMFHGVKHKRGWCGGHYLNKAAVQTCEARLEAKAKALVKFAKKL